MQANTPLALQMQHNDAFSSGGPTPRSNWSPQADRLQHLARHNTQLQVADAPHLRRMFCRAVRGGLPSSCAAWQIMHCGWGTLGCTSDLAKDPHGSPLNETLLTKTVQVQQLPA